MKFKLILSLVIFGVVMASPEYIFAQCPMCKMAAESNLANGGSAGKGLNAGILYLLAMPYIIFIVMYVVWKKNKARLNQA